MTVLSPATGDIFRVTTYKNFIGVENPVWTNDWELITSSTAEGPALVEAANYLALFESKLMLDTSRINRVLITLIHAGTGTVGEDQFISIPYDLRGQRNSIGVLPLPLQYAIYIRKVVLFGRYGKVELRNSLGEGDVQSINGQPAPQDAASLAGGIATAITGSGVDSLFDEGDSLLKLGMYNPSRLSSNRVVQDLVLGGVSIVKHDHKYFDRRSA